MAEDRAPIATCDLFIIAGEVSGDLHGEEVVRALREKMPSLSIAGVAGPRMRALGVAPILPMEEFQVMGFIDVFLALPRLWKLFYKLKKAILQMRPKAVLFIDYPGLNLRLARALHRASFQGALCHYICPSVWIWGKKRIPLMEDVLDALYTILPFEATLFDPKKLSAEFVGHPLVQRIQMEEKVPLKREKDSPVIALFPGSREKEILRNFPIQLAAAEQLKKEHPYLSFGISISHPRFIPLLKECMKQSSLQEGSDFFWVDNEDRYSLMQKADAALAKSGTVTLELALYGVPTVVMYKVSKMDKWIAYDLLRIRPPFYCLVNLIAQRAVFPEFIGPFFTSGDIAQSLDGFLSSPEKKKECRDLCDQVRNSLGTFSASERIASHIVEKFL